MRWEANRRSDCSESNDDTHLEQWLNLYPGIESRKVADPKPLLLFRVYGLMGCAGFVLACEPGHGFGTVLEGLQFDGQ